MANNILHTSDLVCCYNRMLEIENLHCLVVEKMGSLSMALHLAKAFVLSSDVKLEDKRRGR